MELSEFDRLLPAMPKVELHVHLEGTVSAATATELAERHGADPATVLGIEDGDYPRRFRDFSHFVEVFLATSRQIRTPDDLTAVAAAFVREQARQNILYSEATFTATTLIDQGMPPGEMWQALVDGFAEEPSVKVGLIVDTVREHGPEQALRSARFVEEADAPVVALGLTGIEGVRPERDFVELRRAADQLGLGLIVHAGETGTAHNVASAVDDLGADRIAHGIAALDDADLLTRLAESGMPLDVCPTSNVTIGVVDDLASHPLPRLIDAGIGVTIGSDDPPFFSTTLTDELRHAARLANLDLDGLAQLQRHAISVACTDPGTRSRILAALDAWSATAIGAS